MQAVSVSAPPRRVPLGVLLFAMTFPSVVAWFYFVKMATGGGSVNPVQQLTYSLGKVVQFGLPVAFLALVERRRPRLLAPHLTGTGIGLAFGLAVAAAMLGLYFGVLRGSPALENTPVELLHKLQELGSATPARYLLLAAFITLVHSLLEEYYWRWFVFGRLREHVPWVWALVLSSLGFMGHHVIVLYVYLPGQFLTEVVPFSLAIAVGGGVWAWLYERTGTLYPSWLSHAIVDATIFLIGWDLVRQAVS
jgi:membrane protease YdiL (CAAX protease family)